MTCRCAGWTPEMFVEAVMACFGEDRPYPVEVERRAKFRGILALFPPLEPETRPEGYPEGDPLSGEQVESLRAIGRLLEFVRSNSSGGCRVLSKGWGNCHCPLCDLDLLRSLVFARATPGQPSVASPEEREAPAGEAAKCEHPWEECLPDMSLTSTRGTLKCLRCGEHVPAIAVAAPSPVVSGAGEQGEKGYDQGYEDGESSGYADWVVAIEEHGQWPDQAEPTPSTVAAELSRLRATVERLSSENALLHKELGR